MAKTTKTAKTVSVKTVQKDLAKGRKLAKAFNLPGPMPKPMPAAPAEVVPVEPVVDAEQAAILKGLETPAGEGDARVVILGSKPNVANLPNVLKAAKKAHKAAAKQHREEAAAKVSPAGKAAIKAAVKT